MMDVDGNADVRQSTSHIVGLLLTQLVDGALFILGRIAEMFLSGVGVPQEVNNHFCILHQKSGRRYFLPGRYLPM